LNLNYLEVAQGTSQPQNIDHLFCVIGVPPWHITDLPLFLRLMTENSRIERATNSTHFQFRKRKGEVIRDVFGTGHNRDRLRVTVKYLFQMRAELVVYKRVTPTLAEKFLLVTL